MIDSHCHLADEAFVADLAAVVERALAAGLGSALCILSADEPEELARVETVSWAWPAVRFAAAIHPHRAGAYAASAPRAVALVKAAAARVGAVAIGEMGLDYHYNFAPKNVQREVFAAQVDLALALGRPVIIHTRDAADDTLAVLRAAGPRLRGVMHCFTGDVDEARRALDLGFYISLSGIVTFPRSETVREVAAFVPDDRLLIETDAPFLAPVPHRGARNEPAYVKETLAAIASLRGTNLAALERAIDANFRQFLGPSE